MPGAYTVSLTIGSETHAATVEIEADPRRPMTAADRRTRQAALMALHELAEPLYEATQGADRLADQMDEAASLLESHASAPDWLTAEVDSIQHQLEEISDGLQEARQWSRVAAAIQGSSTVPTEDQLWQVDAAWDAVPPLIGRLNDLISRRVPAFNASLDAEGVRPDPGPEIAVPRRGR
jgi:signal transduction histidine kinase